MESTSCYCQVESGVPQSDILIKRLMTQRVTGNGVCCSHAKIKQRNECTYCRSFSGCFSHASRRIESRGHVYAWLDSDSAAFQPMHVIPHVFVQYTVLDNRHGGFPHVLNRAKEFIYISSYPCCVLYRRYGNLVFTLLVQGSVR